MADNTTFEPAAIHQQLQDSLAQQTKANQGLVKALPTVAADLQTSQQQYDNQMTAVHSQTQKVFDTLDTLKVKQETALRNPFHELIGLFDKNYDTRYLAIEGQRASLQLDRLGQQAKMVTERRDNVQKTALLRLNLAGKAAEAATAGAQAVTSTLSADLALENYKQKTHLIKLEGRDIPQLQELLKSGNFDSVAPGITRGEVKDVLIKKQAAQFQMADLMQKYKVSQATGNVKVQQAQDAQISHLISNLPMVERHQMLTEAKKAEASGKPYLLNGKIPVSVQLMQTAVAAADKQYLADEATVNSANANLVTSTQATQASLNTSQRGVTQIMGGTPFSFSTKDGLLNVDQLPASVRPYAETVNAYRQQANAAEDPVEKSIAMDRARATAKQLQDVVEKEAQAQTDKKVWPALKGFMDNGTVSNTQNAALLLGANTNTQYYNYIQNPGYASMHHALIDGITKELQTGGVDLASMSKGTDGGFNIAAFMAGSQTRGKKPEDLVQQALVKMQQTKGKEIRNQALGDWWLTQTSSVVQQLAKNSDGTPNPAFAGLVDAGGNMAKNEWYNKSNFMQELWRRSMEINKNNPDAPPVDLGKIYLNAMADAHSFGTFVNQYVVPQDATSGAIAFTLFGNREVSAYHNYLTSTRVEYEKDKELMTTNIEDAAKQEQLRRESAAHVQNPTARFQIWGIN